MAEDETTQRTQDMRAVSVPAPEPQTSTGQSPLEAHAAADSGMDPLPLAGAAFVGGIVLARILKKLGGGDN